MHSFKTIANNSTAEFTDKGSKFIAIAKPITNAEDFKDFLKEIKLQHPKAVHHCYAYRLGIDKNNFRSNDDGEPSGSAGKPILGQIDSKTITNVAVIVVRYFGGVLLGVPGLINAYKNSTALALEKATIITQNVEEDFLLEFEYLQLDAVLSWVKKHQFKLKNKELEMFCKIYVSIAAAESQKALQQLNRHIKITKI